MIDPERLMNWTFPDIEHSYTYDDVMRHALAVGVGHDPSDSKALRFVEDTKAAPLALPTMAVIVGFPGSWMSDTNTGIDFPRIVHGEEELILHRPLPSEATVVATHRVIDVIDKGAGRGAVIIYDKDIFLKTNGDHLATVRHTTFARGDGGFSKNPALSVGTGRSEMPDRDPDFLSAVAGFPQQALLYRLCADRNPLHSDPETARLAGFEKPILHGLCTFGMAGYALVRDCCKGDPARLASVAARFSRPVFPGETIVIEGYHEGEEIRFRARVRERDEIVLTQGRATIRGAPPV